MQANVRYPDSIAAAVRGASVVINLAAVGVEKGKQRFRAVNVMGARRVAEAAKAAGAKALIHMSVIGADENSPSLFARSRAMGEAEVRAAFPSAIVGLVLALIIMFKRNPSPPLVIAYAVAEGIFLGGISYIIGRALDNVVPGNGIAVIGQAVIGTLGVFLGMLVVYKTGAIRVTPKFTKWITGAIIGVGVLMLFNLILSFFNGGGGIGIRSGGTIAIIFSRPFSSASALRLRSFPAEISAAIPSTSSGLYRPGEVGTSVGGGGACLTASVSVSSRRPRRGGGL